MTIKAVVFDFDGTLMDTESCAFEAIRSIYAEHGEELALETWAVCIGTQGAFDPYADLEARMGRRLDRAELFKRFRARHEERARTVGLLPGVMDRLEEARRLGWRIGLASSSERAWIDLHLERHGIRDYFEAIRTKDDVERVKPDPALYRLAVEALGAKPEEAIAVEDSANGLRAAKAAGLRGLVVPHALTAHMDFSEADWLLGSLEERTFRELGLEAERLSVSR